MSQNILTWLLIDGPAGIVQRRRARRPTNEGRRRFLVGEGVLTAQEVVEWALEIGEPRVELPHDMSPEQGLMIVVVDYLSEDLG